MDLSLAVQWSCSQRVEQCLSSLKSDGPPLIAVQAAVQAKASSPEEVEFIRRMTASRGLQLQSLWVIPTAAVC